MPGRGPAPKDASERRRTNKPARGDWEELSAGPLKGKARVLGVLPKRGRMEKPWHPRTRKAWDAWRSDPATTKWTAADFDSALTVAEEYDTWAYEGGVSRLAEIRKWLDGLGLTSKGKRDNRWRIVAEEEVAPAPKLAEVKQFPRAV